ncbi:multidrug resistance-associated protein 4-like isoform X1 [Bombus vosnesenskii]|uniref:Multidrug resistance-associated protein 4-like isoform X1 n=1 Tax=Bombus vosnesenskii TaxID=207650 RepID=A0A6J3JT36_9HYME|nr:multidrug resistance-associated protein 4-like isoform X1 [Bombus vosnesenskii]XP_033343953.1 multidrug resistance-associated protein 4-like isoform X1 [Bombus vosnesenskii]
MDSSKKYDNPNPKLTANVFSKLIFWWLKPLFWYAKDHDLEIKDIYNVMPNDVSQHLGDKLERNWIKEVKSAEGANRKPKFFNALRKTFMWSFAHYGGWQFFLAVVLRVIQPYVLGLLIWHFDPRATSTANEAYIYASAVILIVLCGALITHHSMLGLMEVGMRVRIACSSLMYRKILRLSRSSTNVTTPGQIINIMSNDVARFEQLFIALHYIWILPIQGALITFMIWESVGIASLAGVFLITMQTVPVQGYLGKWVSKLRLKIAVRTDERVRLMSEIIGGIQVIKMYTWEQPFEKLVSFVRSQEIDVLTVASYLRGFTLATFVFTERTTLYFTIMAYVLLGNTISADKVFSMAQYFNILQLTMAILYPMAVSAAAEAHVSIKRLENFLLLKENNNIIQSQQTNGDGSIMMKNITASWTENTIANTLHDINVQIEPGKLYAIVGSVGAGKSSFLQLILKELQQSHGEIKVNGIVSYASQEAWLFSGTVRNNILFGQSYDKEKYNDVVRACTLIKDFQQFNYGDRTLVGDRGAALSGGQRARINLARAVYRNADIYLLDDPLSAVDTHVGKQLFNECIKNYLRNKTRILVTHQVQYLKDCDYIILLNNGKIECEGTFTEIQSKRTDFLHMLSTEENKGDSEVMEIDDNTNPDLSINYGNGKDDDETEPKETEELMAKGNVSKSLYWKYFRAGGSVLMILIFVWSLIFGQIGSSGCDYWVAYWTKQEEIRIKRNSINHTVQLSEQNHTVPFSADGDTNKSINETTLLEMDDFNSTISKLYPLKNESFDNITWTINARSNTVYLHRDTALWIYGAFILTSIVLTSTRNIVFYKICMNASKNLHNLMFSCLLKAPMLFFDTHPSGRILNRFSKDVGSVDEILPRTMIESIQIFTVMVGILVQVFIINWWTIFPMFIMGFLYWQIRNIYLKTAQDMKRFEGTTKSPVFSHVSSSLLGLTTIRSACAHNMVRKEFDVHQDLHTSAYYLTIATSTAFGFALDVVSICFIAFITYSFIILDDGNTFAGNVGLAISQVLILCGMLQHGMRQTAETISQMTSVERILQFTQLDKEGPFESEPNKKPSAQWPSKGEINFDHLYLRYEDSAPPVLKDLCFTIKSGEKVGIVGRTGAGKTSLISALFRLAKLEGAIYIDKLDTKQIGLHELRRKISIIPQEPVLFSATLRDNLDPFHDFDDATLWAALEDVELKLSVSSLDYNVDQGGANFSVGQRQLLCLARAILRNNKILLLDEATANVDPATDALIQKTIRQKFKSCTVLTIAHRLNTIMDSNKVLVMDHGKAIEFDHPYVLLKNEQSHFTNMVKETGKLMFEQLKKIAEEAYNSVCTDAELQSLPQIHNGETVKDN